MWKPLECHELSFAQFGPRGFSRLFRDGSVIGQLYDEEREVAVARRLAPILDQRGKKFLVLMSPQSVALPLIPQRATQGVRQDWTHHALVEGGHRHRCIAESRQVLDRKTREGALRERQ